MASTCVRAFACLLFFSLIGCTTVSPSKQALNEKAIAVVQADIKHQIALYMAVPPPDTRAMQFWCGSGNIGFDISQVKAELTVTNEAIDNGGVKATIPLVVSVGPSGSLKRDVTNTQVLTYNLWPVADDQQPSLGSADLKSAPIAATLVSLRDALIEGASKSAPGPQACFTDYNLDKPSGDSGDTFKLGLTFVNDATMGLELKVSVLDLTATREDKGTTGNTMTVSFVQKGLKDIQTLQDEVGKECKFPDFNSSMCVVAKQALHLVTAPMSALASEKKALEAHVQALCSKVKPTEAEALECRKATLLTQTAEKLVNTGLGLR
jgi:hypothetical protein